VFAWTIIRFTVDIPPPDTSDLTLDRPDISLEDNAFTYYSAVAKALYFPSGVFVVDHYLEGKNVDQKKLGDIIRKNKKNFEMIAKGNKCERCIVPEASISLMPIPYLSPLLNIGKLLAAKARCERLSNHPKAATETCVETIRFGNLFQKDSERFVAYYVGLAILSHGLEQARDLARDPNTPTEELKTLADAVSKIGPLHPGLVRMAKGEYQLASHVIDSFTAGKLNLKRLGLARTAKSTSFAPFRVLFKPNETKLALAEAYRKVIDDAPLCYTKTCGSDMENAAKQNIPKRYKFLPTPNALGVCFLALATPPSSSAIENKCKLECDVAATSLIIAMQLYKRYKKTYPEQLRDLVPEYIDAIPSDPFDATPFKYDSKKRIIYSVGKDGVDSGGSLPSKNAGNSKRYERWYSRDVFYNVDIPDNSKTPVEP
jgi:hypothetical protein